MVKQFLSGRGVKPLLFIVVALLVVLALCGAELDYAAIYKQLADSQAWKDLFYAFFTKG